MVDIKDVARFKVALYLVIYSICVFFRNLSSVFATAGYETIRIWSTKRFQELLRIMVYNFQCAAIEFSYDGSCIVSAWNDGVIRAFTPISGRLIYAIPNAHNKGRKGLIAFFIENLPIFFCSFFSNQVAVPWQFPRLAVFWSLAVLRVKFVFGKLNHIGKVY